MKKKHNINYFQIEGAFSSFHRMGIEDLSHIHSTQYTVLKIEKEKHTC